MQLVGVHKLGAIMLKSPIVAITDDEGKKMAHAIKNVLQHYNITPDPKTMAWIQLAGVSSVIYGPKIALVVAAQKMQREARQRAAQSPIPTSPLQPTNAAPDMGANFSGQAGVYKFQ